MMDFDDSDDGAKAPETEFDPNQFVNPSITWVFHQWAIAGGFKWHPCLLYAYQAYYEQGWKTGKVLVEYRLGLEQGKENKILLADHINEFEHVKLTDEQLLFIKAMDTTISYAFITHAILSGQVDAQAEREVN